ncbi:3-hydroxyisobutyrate dehydrogenase [Aurantiacibacter gangjinensis]|uniref:3-hydroxyisobutyrate dehydrogenase n=1 Tax=Aurantiacibacter gangjinensis TaxID=502682 RepID=A0A0G9MPH0_9SPHN|nr:3-hydroxyisobutyrate dehydrogenase [Aurantiacibacter gangjinensis]APE29435.1 3-hydroxyisobutyrate dehydrogenase [Aurantiacibacter gangjinensis]KLE31178.1 3-hydroxyisobutyrate dehydrogenase [Aurantiacibacter gangjinensis]
MKIAFIGLGNMGGGMAANLVKAGHEVNAFDLSEAALGAAAEKGCETFTDAREAVAGVEAVVTMLPNGDIVRAVYTDTVIGNAPADAVLLDCSTIDVTSARDVIAAAEAAGHDMVDAPVSGGIAAAEAGTLTFMVGGSETAFMRAQPILQAMGKAVIHAGDAGNGQAAKICNNMLLAVHMIGTAEAFAMAQKLGLDPQTFYDISSVSSGQNWSMTSYCPVPGVGPKSPADNDYQGGFATALMLKDLKLAMEAAGTAHINPRIGALAKELYEAFDAAGNGTRDFSAIITEYS